LDKWVVADGTTKSRMFAGATSFKQPATRKHFGLVLSSPSCTHAVRSYRQSRMLTTAPTARTLAAQIRADCSAELHYARIVHGSAGTRHRGRARLRTRANQAVDAAHALRRAAAHARSSAGVLTALTEYPRTVARALCRPTSACVADAGVASPGVDTGADVGGRSACAPQSGAVLRTVADPTASAAETAASAVAAVQPLGAVAPGRTVRLASDSPTGVGDSARATVL
jgi:hypothetical protein